MIINSITLDNFKSHKHTIIKLNKGISVILGGNGAGKSSIFEAISYSFFKTYTGKLEDLIRKPADENDIVKEMQVTVEFEHDSRYYKIIRGNGKKIKAKLYYKENKDYKAICDGDTEVTKEIESILNLDSKSFLNAIYIRQGEITDLIEKTASEKKELIAKLLNIDSLQKASDNLKSIIDIYKTEISENNGKLSEKNNVEKEINDLNNKNKEKESELSKINSEIEELSYELKTLQIEVLQSDNNKIEYTNLNNQINQQHKIVKNIKENKQKVELKIEEIKKCEEKLSELEKYVNQLPHLHELKEYETLLKSYTNDATIINETIEKINKNKRIIEETRENYEKYETAKTEKKNLEEKRLELESEFNKNQKTLFKLNELKERNKAHVKNIRETSDESSKLFGENFNSPEEIEKKVNEEKLKVKKNIEEINETIQENNKNISVIKNNLSTIEKSLKELENTKDTCPICQSTISHEKHLELSEEYKQKISKYNKSIDKLTKENEIQKKELNASKNYFEDIKEINILKLNEEYEEFNKILNKIKEYEEQLPEIEENNIIFEDIKKKITENNNLLIGVEKDYKKFQIAFEILKDLPNIDEEKKKLNELNSKINEIKGECREIIQKYRITDNLDYLIKYAEKKVEEYNQNKGIIQGKNSLTKEHENLTNNLTKEENILKNFEDEINNLSYDEETYKKIHDTYTSQENKLKECQIIKNTIETETKSNKQQLDIKNKKLQELKELSEEQENLKKYVEILKFIRDLYGKDGVQKDLRNNARPDIEKHTLNFFNEFGFEYTSLELDDDYNIFIENKNERLELKMMSGGEKIVIALALRLGIASTVSKNRTDVLLLDEPTIHLDSERRRLLIDTIRQIQIVPQMIVVSHDDELETLSTNIIKLQKQNGISSIDDS